MKRRSVHSQCVTFLLLACFGISSSAGQGAHGIEIAVGTAEGFGLAFSAAYFHPLPLKQFYAIGGVSFCSRHSSSPVASPTDGYTFSAGASHSTIQRFFVGVQVGDYVFAVPKLSLNTYGNKTSPGWSLEGGLMLHPSRSIAFGFKFSYDRFQFGGTGREYWPDEVNTMAFLFRIKFDN